MAAFWQRCQAVADVPIAPADTLQAETRGFLVRRGLWRLRREIARADLARLTPLPSAPREAFPEWWRPGRAHTWRLVIRAWTARGELASVHGRAVVPPPQLDGEEGPKVLWPKHPDPEARYDHARLLFANPTALGLLRGVPLPGPVAYVVILEGLTDWLATAAHVAAMEERLAELGADHPRIAVFGGVSGSFPALADVRWPEDSTFLTGVDDDPAGRRYALEIVRALAPRPVRPIPVAKLLEQPRG